MFLIYIALMLSALLIYIGNRKNLPGSFVFLALLLALTLISELVKIFLKRHEINTSFMDHFFQPAEFVLISTVYYHAFYGLRNKSMVKIMIPLFIVAAFFVSTFIDGWNAMNRSSFLMESFILVVYAVIYMLEILNKPANENLLKKPFFWVNTGILFYCSGTFFQVGLHEYFENRNPALAKELNLINQVLNYLLYSSFIAGFLCRTRKF